MDLRDSNIAIMSGKQTVILFISYGYPMKTLEDSRFLQGFLWLFFFFLCPCGRFNPLSGYWAQCNDLRGEKPRLIVA